MKRNEEESIEKVAESGQFARVEIDNWRNFLHASVDLRPRTFVVGPNASGKSNFLDVFRFLQEVASPGAGGLRAAVDRRGGLTSLRCLAARKNPDVVLQVGVRLADRDWTYKLQIRQEAVTRPREQRPVVGIEEVTLQGEFVLRRPDGEDENDRERLTQTALEQVNLNQRFRPLAEFLRSVEYLHLVPQIVRQPDKWASASLDPYGGDFLERIARMPAKSRGAMLKRILRALKSTVPQIKTLTFERDKEGKPHLLGKYAHWRPQGAWQREAQFSDGTLRLIGLLWSVASGAGPLLMEEPELSLHPGLVRYLPGMFARMQSQSGRQVIVSTHSEALLADQGVGADEVLIVRPAAEGSQIASAHQMKAMKILLESGWSMADVVFPESAPEGAQQLALFE